MSSTSSPTRSTISASTTLSSFYLDIVKDRLYCEARGQRRPAAARRPRCTSRSDTLAKLFAPILAFTCDEIWLAMPHTGEDDARNVVLNEMNKPFTAYALDAETMARWEHIIAVRTVVNGALEEARAAKVIGKSLEADVHLTVPESDRVPRRREPRGAGRHLHRLQGRAGRRRRARRQGR